MAELETQGNYILLVKVEINRVKTDGCVLLTQETQDKKEKSRPIARIVAIGKEANCEFPVGSVVFFDPVQTNAAFKYKDKDHYVCTDKAILLKVQFPTLIS